MNEEEIRRALELTKYFVLLPAYGSIYRKIDYSYSNVINKTVVKPYHSANHTPLAQSDLAEFLLTHKLLEKSR